jgi:hypothetical protein
MLNLPAMWGGSLLRLGELRARRSEIPRFLRTRKWSLPPCGERLRGWRAVNEPAGCAAIPVHFPQRSSPFSALPLAGF